MESEDTVLAIRNTPTIRNIGKDDNLPLFDKPLSDTEISRLSPRIREGVNKLDDQLKVMYPLLDDLSIFEKMAKPVCKRVGLTEEEKKVKAMRPFFLHIQK